MKIKLLYNGWSNKETWLASLWLNENKYSQRVLLEAKEHGSDVLEQAEWLDGLLRMQLDDEIAVACLWRDLLQTAYSQINWTEIVESI